MAHYKGRDNYKRRRARAKRNAVTRDRKHPPCEICGARVDTTRSYVTIQDLRTGRQTMQHTACSERAAYRAYRRSGILSSKLVMAANFAHFYYEEAHDGSRWKRPVLQPGEFEAIYAAQERLHTAVKTFERERWFNGGLQQFVLDQSHSALGGSDDMVEVRLLTLAGRCMITIEDKGTRQSITVITADNEKPYARREYGSEDMGPMGIQGFDCTEAVGLALLEHVTSHWPAAVGPQSVVYAGVRIPA